MTNEERDNSQRLPDAQQSQKEKLDPLEFIESGFITDLPSKGQVYKEDHPLYGKESIEARSMKAKEEEILNNRDFVKSGIAIDKVLNRIIKDRNVTSSDLYSGDKDALLIDARIDAYGPRYDVTVTCPVCGEHNKTKHNIEENLEYHRGIEDVGDGAIEKLKLRRVKGNRLFQMTLPETPGDQDLNVVIRPVMGDETMKLQKKEKRHKKNNINFDRKVELVSSMVKSIGGNENQEKIKTFLKKTKIRNVRAIERAYELCFPRVTMMMDFYCESCRFDDRREVPIRGTFFWPDRE